MIPADEGKLPGNLCFESVGSPDRLGIARRRGFDICAWRRVWVGWGLVAGAWDVMHEGGWWWI